MAATNIIVGLDATFITTPGGTGALSGAPFLTDFAPVVAAQMDGAASVAFTGAAPTVSSARMDGAAAVAFTSAVITSHGAARADGVGTAAFVGAMRISSVAQMNGAASMVAAAVPPPVPAIAQMDGAASMSATGSLTGPNVRNVAMVQNIISKSTLVPSWNAVLSLVQTIGVSQTVNPRFIWGRTLTQAFRVSAAVAAGGLYKKSLAQLFKLSEVEGFTLRHPVALSQNLNLSLSLAGGISLKLLQKFLIATTSSPVFHYHLALAGRVLVKDVLDRYAHAILTQLFTVHPTLNRQFISNNSLAQLLTVHPAFTNKLILEMVEHSDLALSSEQLVHMIYKGDPLLDGITITALYISPSGTTTTWAVNTRTNAVTEYLNYGFRSFAQMGNKYIAAGTGGLYELDGDTDDGTAIISRLMSGYIQLNEKKLFGIKGAYIAIRGGGRFYLKLISGDGREYVYELKAQPNLMTTKVRVGKGIKTTYMAFELVTEGQDFDLDSIEFIPMTSGRRV